MKKNAFDRTHFFSCRHVKRAQQSRLSPKCADTSNAEGAYSAICPMITPELFSISRLL